MKDVDVSTDNLDIEGTLTITGDVKPGMHVKATADNDMDDVTFTRGENGILF